MDSRIIDILLAYDQYICSRHVKETLAWKSKFLLGTTLRKILPSLNIFYSEPQPVLCDILFIYYTPLKELLRALGKKGFRVCHESLSAKRILLNKMLCEPDKTLPKALLYYNAVLKFLVKKYQPKIICSSLDYSPFASFLRCELQRTGGKCINIAHAISSSRYLCTMFDFDYYFLFGQSSLQNILANPVRIGNTRAVLTGSPFIAPDYSLPPNREKKNVLFFSQLPHGKFQASSRMKPYIEDMKIVINWAKLHPEFHLFIKPRPKGKDVGLIHNLAKGVHNITVLDKSVSMIEALKDVSLVLNTASNASIEAAVLNRPTVVVNKGGLWTDYLSFEEFFLPRATNEEELHQNILQTFENYDKFLQKTQEFAKFHLEHTTDSIEFMADCIESIYHGEENFSYVPIHEELSGLKPYITDSSLIW